MKKTIIMLFFAFMTVQSYSQTTEGNTINLPPENPSKDYSNTIEMDELYLKSKMELTQIYLNEVKILVNNLPFTPFTLMVDSEGMEEGQKIQLDIPKTKYTTKKLDKVTNSTNSTNKVIQSSLFEVIPYSDRSDIIDAIFYVRSINRIVKQVN